MTTCVSGPTLKHVLMYATYIPNLVTPLNPLQEKHVDPSVAVIDVSRVMAICNLVKRVQYVSVRLPVPGSFCVLVEEVFSGSRHSRGGRCVQSLHQCVCLIASVRRSSVDKS